MDNEWVFDAEGNMELPLVCGYSMAVLSNSLMALQLRAGGEQSGKDFVAQRLQVAITAHSARELAAALMQAADAVEGMPTGGKMN